MALDTISCNVWPDIFPQEFDAFVSSFDVRQCAVTADAVGRYHAAFANGLTSPVVLSVNAAWCAGRVRHVSWAAALILYDFALQQIAGSGGPRCFDSSSWSRLAKISAHDVFTAHADVLQKVLLHWHNTNFAVGSAACSIKQRFRTSGSNPDQIDSDVRAWNQEVLNAGRPFWDGKHFVRMGSLPKVSCLVPVVWPAQEAFLEAISETYGSDCDVLRFFVSSTQTLEVPAAMQYSLINLHAWYPDVPLDEETFHRRTGQAPQHDNFNTIIKLLHMLRWEAEHGDEHSDLMGEKGEQWWYCRLERDTFFIPENFRYFVVSERLDAAEPHYLGTRQFNDVPRFGFVYNDGGPGVCLSRRALTDLSSLLVEAPFIDGRPTFQDCVFAVGHREDLMLAACLRQLGVLPSALTTDAFGREWFSIRPMLGLPMHQPVQQRLFPGNESGNEAWNFWMGRGHLYLPCFEYIRTWVVEMPVSFNSFKNVSMFTEAKSILELGPQARQKRLGYALHLSGLRRHKDAEILYPSPSNRIP
ncbi:NSF [Symbiodinium necroappetens]|uniref:NSF protein n=1 Tax=Symbiodinium necroappetens TaxID=1628268 RepID=A0A812VF64_9DINO|nr:NSF [Symbiodinium necroappetens]